MATGTDVLTTRFAPSPTGYLHLGHAHSALFAWDLAKKAGGRFLLRIEDIDTGRCRPEFEAAIYEDLAWLGLSWDTPVRRQSEHLADYQAALARLRAADLLYPCFCTRKDIHAELAQAPSAPHGPDGPIYPGTCRALDPAVRAPRIERGDAYALRLDIARAMASTGPLHWHDRAADRQQADPGRFGDVVLARRDIATSYHLAVAWDDAEQGINLVTRGVDLFAASHVHRLLQALLGLPVPVWHHHELIHDETGKRLAKRHGALAIRALRAGGRSPAEVRALAGFPDDGAD
jgi:glutamyl-Q tRNA(Asp) synthetase